MRLQLLVPQLPLLLHPFGVPVPQFPHPISIVRSESLLKIVCDRQCRKISNETFSKAHILFIE
jgi:hypothetical protein